MECDHDMLLSTEITELDPVYSFAGHGREVEIGSPVAYLQSHGSQSKRFRAQTKRAAGLAALL